MRSLVAVMDHSRALALDPDPHAAAGQPGGSQTEEGGVGGVMDPHQARATAPFPDAFEECGQDFVERHAAGGLVQADAEAGTDAHHYISGIVATTGCASGRQAPVTGILLPGGTLVLEHGAL